MNALKVVALRLQGMKGALEELNEPVDDLMEVSKIQTQILNLTQNQVDIYDQANDKFRSTYDILKDVSEIWDTLSSTERASLTEIMFGKLRANQGLAIIQAFQSGQIEKAYEASINAAGTATKENEEMMKGIQAHINALKGAFEELSNAVIDSGFLKTVIDSGKTIIEILTWITKNLGTLTTVGAGVGLFAGFKNIGLFNLSAIKEATVAFAAYNTQLKIGNQHLATQTALQGTENASLRTYIANLNGAKASLGSYTAYLVKTKIETIALRVATIALNTALTMGISLAIQGIGTLIDKLVITKDELNEISDAAVNDMNELAESIKKLNADRAEVANLVQQYHSLASSTGDISSKKDELIKIQDSLVEKYGDEAKSIDLVNGKYDDQIAKIKALSDAEYDDWKTKNAAKIAKANKMADYNVGWYRQDTHSGKLVAGDQYEQNFLKSGVQWEDKLAASLYKVKGVSQDIQDIWQDIEGVEFVDGIFSNDLYLTGSLEDAKEQLRQLIQTLTDAGADDKVLEPLTKQFTKIDEALEEIATYGTESEKLADNEVTNIKAVGDAIVTNIDNLKQYTSTLKDGRSEWFETLKEFQQESENTVGKISKAIQSIADGDKISSKDFWELVELDTNHILTDIQLVGDEFVVSQEQLIKLKDEYINKQVNSLKLKNAEIEKQKEDLKVAIERAKVEMAILGSKGLGKEASAAQRAIEQAERALGELEEQQMRNNALIEEANSRLGDTADYVKNLKKQLDALNNDLDDYVKAFEYRIDRNINGLQEELDVLNEQKDAMQAELDVLNEQEDSIDEIIGKYDTVNSLIQKSIEQDIKKLEDERDAIKDNYDARIKALQDENKEREDSLEYAQKLKNLDNAKNDKVRVYDEARGWHYATNQDDVKKAQNDLSSFETRKAIELLESQRDALIDSTEDVINSKKAYAEQFKNLADIIQTEADEELAAELLGADWRERIANGDVDLLEKFSVEYRKHNGDLRRLTDTEIKYKKEAIKAKDAEIDAKKKQIEAWQKYKTDVQNAVKDVKEAQEGYMTVVNQLDSEEPLTLDNRATAFEKFRDRVVTAIGNITSLQSQIEGVTSSLNGDHTYTMSFNVENKGDIDEANNTLGQIQSRFDGIADVAMRNFMAFNKQQGVVTWGTAGGETGGVWGSSEWSMPSHANGGVVDYTGVAMLHGTKQRSETIFNANDSAKLYEMVHNTPNLMADMLNQATKLSGFKLGSNENTNNSSVSIGAINVYANNPQEFTRGLDKQLDRYFKTKLTQSYTQ